MYHKKPDKQTITLAEWINGKNANEAMARPTKQKSLAKKLKTERFDLKDKLLQLDDALINPEAHDIDSEQSDLLKIQRNAITTYCSVLDARIHRLEE